MEEPTRFLAPAVVTADGAGTVHRPGWVEVLGDRITGVGPGRGAPGPVGGTVVELEGLLMPGLVNCHAHSPMTLFRGVGEGLPLDRWLREAIWPREAHLTPEDVYWGMLLAADEMLRCGVTTSCETYFDDGRIVDAAVDAGLRCLVTPGIVAIEGAEAPFTWPALLDRASQLHADAQGRAGLIEIGFGPHAAYTLPLDALEAVGERARDVGALLHIHLAETAGEGASLEAEHGVTVPGLLARLGVLDGRVLAAHSVWLTDDDLDLYARMDVAVAHCPQSNAKLGSGVARLAEMLEAGIRVGLGTDGPASNNDLDLWEEMRLAPLLARATAGDPTRVSVDQALTLATGGGAAALGLETGILEPGRLADLVHLTMADSRFVPLVEPGDLLAHLVWSASSQLVRDVWVGGRQVVAAGSSLTIDAPGARAEVQRRAERLAAALG